MAILVEGSEIDTDSTDIREINEFDSLALASLNLSNIGSLGAEIIAEGGAALEWTEG